MTDIKADKQVVKIQDAPKPGKPEWGFRGHGKTNPYWNKKDDFIKKEGRIIQG